MLKAEVTKEYTKVESIGGIPDICSDLTHILCAINERLTEMDAKAGYHFRVVFTKGFMDGICFDDDREHMEHYLAEADKAEEKGKEKAKDVAEVLGDFIEWLKEKNEALEKFNKAFEDAEGEKDDEAE